ncbi:MAG TPA: alpha/beta fold hydrolase [Puia sp.]|nr:alpha/beta fold hydrolase [Puia sp.]
MPFHVYCFPFAGGSRYSYLLYTKAARDLKLIPLDYPGRGFRAGEPLLRDLHEIADDCLGQIRHRLGEPYAIYGHSMGAVVGYLVTKRIIREGLGRPEILFFSGRGGPSIGYPEKMRYLLPTSDFRDLLRAMGGNSDEVLDNEELMSFFEPIIRADFEALETCRYVPGEAFDIPITVMIGADENVTLEHAYAWQRETTERIDVRLFPGKHFFIFDHAADVVRLMEHKIANLNIDIQNTRS